MASQHCAVEQSAGVSCWLSPSGTAASKPPWFASFSSEQPGTSNNHHRIVKLEGLLGQLSITERPEMPGSTLQSQYSCSTVMELF